MKEKCRMSRYEQVKEDLRTQPKKWLITGCAGFIGSNLLETLLKLNQTVVGIDNFSTGHQHNLDAVKGLVEVSQWKRFKFINGDIRDMEACREGIAGGVNYVLHQAALGSVPRSITDPIATNDVNINGFLNIIIAARDAEVDSFVYAASSSTYGDHPSLPKIEDRIGKPLSPYAVTKYVNELYAEVFFRCYGLKTVGLRYFNVFGKRQDPNGVYAAVIPKWISAMLKNEDIFVNGDGETSRDFCFIDNVVQANILAATATSEDKNQVYNVAVSDVTTLNQLIELLRTNLVSNGISYDRQINHRNFRQGDVRHSQADISKAKKRLGYEPTHTVREGISEAVKHFTYSLK